MGEYMMLSALVLLVFTSYSAAAEQKSEGKVNFLRNTPIMIVDSINPALPFWTEKMGFKKDAVFPEEGEPAFAMLTKGEEEVMFQTAESILAEHPHLKPLIVSGAIIQYIDVDSLETALSRVSKGSIVVPPKETFYGTKEAMVKDPSGFLLVFAEKKGGQ